MLCDCGSLTRPVHFQVAAKMQSVSQCALVVTNIACMSVVHQYVITLWKLRPEIMTEYHLRTPFACLYWLWLNNQITLSYFPNCSTIPHMSHTKRVHWRERVILSCSQLPRYFLRGFVFCCCCYCCIMTPVRYLCPVIALLSLC